MNYNFHIRYFAWLAITLIISSVAHGQILESHYKITKTMYQTDPNGIKSRIAILDFQGFVYQDGPKYISFKKPLYLQDYPDGAVHIQTAENKETDYALPMDSIQGIFYVNFDSLKVRQRVDMPGKDVAGINFSKPFHRGWVIWQYENETRTINGLKCQKATFINTNQLLQWVVWFCPDIPASGGPDGIVDLPGLVVEAENMITDTKYTLESYTTQVSIPQSIFWPRQFYEPFK